jgi:hypothetical protein
MGVELIIIIDKFDVLPAITLMEEGYKEISSVDKTADNFM